MDRDRGEFKGLRIIAFAMAFLAGGALADVPADPAPINLGEDEIYRRDGALVRLKTCLAVADDRYVPSLIEHPSFEITIEAPPDQVLRDLRAALNEIKDRRGFGTLLACAQIVAAWQSITLTEGDSLAALTQPARATDGRFEHGAVVIDLSMQGGRRAFIEPMSLARLLSQPDLLPHVAYGGIVLKNAIINGPLVLHGLHLTHPLTFVNVTFAGQSYSQTVFDLDERIPATALAIGYAKFSQHLLFANSVFCGHVRINDSEFTETLLFQDVEQRAIGCTRQPEPSSEIELSVKDSRFVQSLSLVRTRLAAASIVGGDLADLHANNSSFGRALNVIGNDVGSLQVRCSPLASKVRISSNQIRSDLVIEGTAPFKQAGNVDTTCSAWWDVTMRRMAADHQTLLEVADNRIGGGLHLRNFLGSTLADRVRLPSNWVGSSSKFYLPASIGDGEIWTGDVDLQGSTYEGTLSITRDRWPESEPAADESFPAYCREIHGKNRLRGIAVDFRAAHVRTLHWDLPLTCANRWLGYGFTYDLWLKGGLAKNSLGAAINGLKAAEIDHFALSRWRYSLRRYDSSSLSGMSRYLSDKGALVDSRNILEEAKRLDYWSSCPPDEGIPTCLWQFISGDEPGSASLVSGARADDRSGNDGPVMAERVWRFTMLALLWPGGYGAKPERAILLLMVATIIFWSIYRWYAARMRRDLERLPVTALPGAFLARAVPDIRPRAGLADSPALPFDDADAGSREHPSTSQASQTWANMTVDERFSCIRTSLLERVRTQGARADADDFSMPSGERLSGFGTSETPGFSLVDPNKAPSSFTLWRYSIDTMLPVVDLHAYAHYYPEAKWIRAASIVQHMIGWWLVTVFIASAAIL